MSIEWSSGKAFWFIFNPVFIQGLWSEVGHGSRNSFQNELASNLVSCVCAYYYITLIITRLPIGPRLDADSNLQKQILYNDFKQGSKQHQERIARLYSAEEQFKVVIKCIRLSTTLLQTGPRAPTQAAHM